MRRDTTLPWRLPVVNSTPASTILIASVHNRWHAAFEEISSQVRVFDDVPPAVQRQIVEHALIPFLDTIPKSNARAAITKARWIVKKYDRAPQLDLAAKKVEVNGLLDELTKDAKIFVRHDWAKYEILLQEVVESVAEWLNDIWIIAYEFGLDFTRAHSCLLFSTGVLDHVQNLKGSGCECVFSTIYVPISIKNSSGEVVKEFSELGLANVESAILWVWRDVFLSLLASNNQTFVKLVPVLLAEIDDILGWQGLERLILGGLTFSQCTLEREKHSQVLSCDHCHCHFHDPDLDSDYYDEDDIFYADHWKHKLTRKVPLFVQHVQDRMMVIFEASPSVQLFTTLGLIARDDTSQDELNKIISSIATSSATSLAIAIEIYTLNKKPNDIAKLLESHAYLLRPCDSGSLQGGVCVLAATPVHLALALAIIKSELLDTARTVLYALQKSFARLDAPEQRAELPHIARLPRGTAARTERVHRWVEAAVTPGAAPANPMVFAAMMMGLPVPFPVGAEDTDELGFLEIDLHDPDFAELREEFRPDIKGRFDSWIDVAESLEGGTAVLERVYKQVFDLMPWLLAQDIVQEMVGRLADKPSKHHICDALESLSTFAKAQRKKRSRKNAQRQALRANAPLLNPPETAPIGPVSTDAEEALTDVRDAIPEVDVGNGTGEIVDVVTGPTPLFTAFNGAIEDLD
ncbi:hypothetical protein EW145_g7128 [Phellinidium pouzarii]|uniref:Uncharacterized protein n=1 Tax=Phellinidium pouzarii TaxID=167371 RepID=A0A4S4KPC1_9AGAM|nr:hypothetical protein EW145_g7128 [Phellinidium pouzarii]